LSEKDLEIILTEMINLVEYSFDVNVEDIEGDNSYWIETPEDEIEELELFGIIEIGEDQCAFQKIISLTHETGHAIYHSDPYFKTNDNTLFRESLAWYLGYHFMAEHGYTIDPEYYDQDVARAIYLYVKSENTKDQK
tara:strand:- start:3092 stop:3502 length:411 start_codon:yes stop_codon:yes gene_type:complete